MGFGDALKSQFDSFMTSANTNASNKIGEVFLFDVLIQAFSAVWGISTVLCKRTHGSSGFVGFRVSNNWVNGKGGAIVAKEIADILFLVYSARKGKGRFVFLQNKFQRNSNCVSIDKCDLLQLDLLAARPTLLHCPAYMKTDILKKARVPSVGSYGLFTYDKHTNTYDMSYFSADKLSPLHRTGKSIVRSANFGPHFGKLRNHNGITDIDSTQTLSEFSEELISFNIGEPFTPSTLACFKQYFLNKKISVPADFTRLILRDANDNENSEIYSRDEIYFEHSNIHYLSRGIVFVSVDELECRTVEKNCSDNSL